MKGKSKEKVVQSNRSPDTSKVIPSPSILRGWEEGGRRVEGEMAKIPPNWAAPNAAIKSIRREIWNLLMKIGINFSSQTFPREREKGKRKREIHVN